MYARARTHLVRTHGLVHKSTDGSRAPDHWNQWTFQSGGLGLKCWLTLLLHTHIHTVTEAWCVSLNVCVCVLVCPTTQLQRKQGNSDELNREADQVTRGLQACRWWNTWRKHELKCCTGWLVFFSSPPTHIFFSLLTPDPIFPNLVTFLHSWPGVLIAPTLRAFPSLSFTPSLLFFIQRSISKRDWLPVLISCHFPHKALVVLHFQSLVPLFLSPSLALPCTQIGMPNFALQISQLRKES